MKLFASVAEMEAIQKIRRPKGSVHTLDQIVAQARNGFRYPFAQYGIPQDVRAGMAVSYPERK